MLDRRRFLAACSGLGLGSTLFPGVLWTLAAGKDKITLEMIDQAAAIADVPIPADDRQMMLDNLNDHVKGFEDIYKLHMPNSVAPALVFDPVLPATKFETEKRPLRMSPAPAIAARGVPKNLEDVCFFSARDWAALVRTKKVSSVALTEMYLERLKRYDPLLHFVITFTDDRAQAKAKEADREITAGKYRGPLHGLPWGAKDLLSVAGYRTTWGAGGFENQKFDDDATVVKRLDAAGAVLVGKLSLGALALDDHWFGAKTRNPWNPAQGSSGSSAGSASATAAGCVVFSIGSETLGSISSPSTRCGCTGLRPSFGLVPRTGAMALSWSMDKLGPVCRAVEDTALVLRAIYGPDGADRAVQPAAFNWNAELDWRKLHVGYLKADFEHPFEGPAPPSKPEAELSPEEKKKLDEQKARREQVRKHAEYDRRFNQAAIAKLQSMGVNLIPVELPKFPYDAMVPLLEAEAAAAFDELPAPDATSCSPIKAPTTGPTPSAPRVSSLQSSTFKPTARACLRWRPYRRPLRDSTSSSLPPTASNWWSRISLAIPPSFCRTAFAATTPHPRAKTTKAKSKAITAAPARPSASRCSASSTAKPVFSPSPAPTRTPPTSTSSTPEVHRLMVEAPGLQSGERGLKAARKRRF
jgi:Asp-tRNA(Asn)/Glu-tRNA(Gln) amidotransferase A subunit family amidase